MDHDINISGDIRVHHLDLLEFKLEYCEMCSHEILNQCVKENPKWFGKTGAFSKNYNKIYDYVQKRLVKRICIITSCDCDGKYEPNIVGCISCISESIKKHNKNY